MRCDSPFHVYVKARPDAVPVPCGRCPPCKQRRVNSWVFRLLQEDKVSLSAYFVTLTYDGDHVPLSDNGFLTLKKSDFQNFMKRLRKLCGQAKLKYYAVGEYGSNNKRPHYHAIIFNVPDEALFAQAWMLDGKQLGGVHVGSVTGDSIAYTMKYLDKPNFAKRHARDDREPEFPLMSKGLGASYLTPEMVKYHRADFTRLFATKEGGYKIALPKYYRNAIFSEQERKYQSILVDQIVKDAERLDRLRFNGADYDAAKGAERYARHQKFYSRLKKRNL